MRLPRHREVLGVLVVALEGNKLVGLIGLHDTVQNDSVHHVREGVQNLVPPCEGGCEVDVADFGALAEGKFLHHAVDVEVPERKVLLGLVENGIVGEAEGLPAVLTDEPLASVPVAVLHDVLGTADGADQSLLVGEEPVEGGGGDGFRDGIGDGVRPVQKGGFLVWRGIREELAEDFNLGCRNHAQIVPHIRLRIK